MSICIVCEFEKQYLEKKSIGHDMQDSCQCDRGRNKRKSKGGRERQNLEEGLQIN